MMSRRATQKLKCSTVVLALLLAALLFVLPRHANAQVQNPGYSNEPAGSTPYYSCDFNNTICGMGDTYNSATYASPGLSGQMNPGALDQYMLAGSRNGSGQWGLGFPAKREIFVAFNWATTVTGYPNNTNKLVFIRGGNSNSFLVWQGGPNEPTKTLKWYQQEYVDNSQATGCGQWGNLCYNTTGDGTGWFEPNAGGNSNVTTGSGFHKVEIYLMASTTASSADGIVRIWVDGVLTTDYTNVNQSPDGFNEVIITSTWDGGAAFPTDWHHYFDDMYVSFPNCPDGCPVTGNTGGGGGGDGGTYKPRQVHTKYINQRPGEVAELKHKSNRNFFQIYGVPPICSLSAGTFSQTSQAWELTKTEMETVTLTCPPEFCGSVSLTVLSLEKKDSLGGTP